MSKKIDKMIENDFNKSYQTKVLIDYGICKHYVEDTAEEFKPKLAWLKHMAKAFVILIVMILVFVGCLGVKQYNAKKIELSQPIYSAKVIDKNFGGLNEVELSKFQRVYSNYSEIPILVIYYFDGIRIYIYWGRKNILDDMYIDYFCLVEYAKNNSDETSILIDGKEVLHANTRTFMPISSNNLELFDTTNQLEFEVNYRGESRKVVAKNN